MMYAVLYILFMTANIIEKELFMSGTQRVFVFKLGVAFAAGLTFVGIFVGTGNATVASAAFAFLALMSLENKVRGKEPMDERDQSVLTRASLVGHGVFWVCFVFGCVGVSLWASPNDSVPASVVGIMPMAGWWLLEVSRSTAGLVLYARGS